MTSTRTEVTPVEFAVDYERETDGRWIAEVEALPGVLSYGMTRESAGRAAVALALRILASQIETGDGDAEFSIAFTAK
jgi:predicted RNase H-like HicB family nuclease